MKRSDAQSAKYQKALLIDENEIDNFINERMITSCNFAEKVVVKNSGPAALDYLRQVLASKETLPEIIFLDLNMPRKGGMQCLKEIRENDVLNQLTVAIYSTSSSQRDIEETFVKGANIYIKKPNDFQQLKKTIAHVISVNWQYQTAGLNKEMFFLNV